MIKRKILIFIFSLLLIVSLMGQISASFLSLNIMNEFQNGIIDIEINETQANNNKTNNQAILPFDKIDKDISITNKGSDCFVRVKLIYSNDDIANNSDVIGMDSDWVLNNDGYYYYANTLNSGDTVNVFKGIKLGNIDKQYQLSDFNIDVEINAIQSQNFAINLDSSLPWGNVKVAKVDRDANLTEYKQNTDNSFKIIYENNVDGMVKNFDKFFNDMQYLMPGDCYEDVLEIQNNSANKKTIYFATQDASNEEFLSKVIFTISDENGDIIFKGNLGESNIITLITVNANENAKINFKAEVLPDVDNAFALDKSSVTWVFSTDNNIKMESAPQTGDTSKTNLYLLLMIISIIGLLLSAKGLKYIDKNS